MEHLHREIMQLIIRRRSALTQAQIEANGVGYNRHLIEGALWFMVQNGWMTSMTEKGKTFYQLTLMGYQMLESEV